MKLDFATLAFGYNVKVGGATANWATALGQGKEHKINDNPEISEMLKGMMHSAVSLEKVSTKIGKGGNVVFGNIEDSPIVLAAVFKKVYINDTLINGGQYILMVTKDTSKSHAGRLRLKYGPSNTYVENNVSYSNQTFIQQVKKQLGMSEDACWFVSEINVKNQDTLVLKAIIVDAEKSIEYENTSDLHNAWELLEPNITQNVSNYQGDKEKNRIIFGAPGTGKSYTLEKDKDELLGVDSQDYERVTFHPNYSYANFVGTYKPVMVNSMEERLNSEKQEVISILTDNSKSAQERYDLLFDRFNGDGLTRLPLLLGLCTDDSFKTKKQDGTDAVGDNSVERNHGKYIRPYVQFRGEDNKLSEIAYEYVPGPFIRILVKALKSARTYNPQPYLLMIEEINRANVSAVFGEVFQLLDRNEYGESEYSINATEDIKNYLAKPENLGGKPSDYEKIKIPSNMYIWATMNSADQGVFPMDTAFKRRWEFEYIGVDAEASEVENYIIPIGDADHRKFVKWNDLRKRINDILSSDDCKVNEDKLLGSFFMSKNMLESACDNQERFVKAFESKVIMYLFEDAMKMRPANIFKGHKGKMIFSEICKTFEERGEGLFGISDIDYIDREK